MIDLSAFSKDKPPNILYKYASQDGLLGICDSHTIWATDIFYMNDAAEYSHAVYIMEKQIKERLAKYEKRPLGLVSAWPVERPVQEKHDKEGMEQIFLNLMNKIIGKLSNYHIFVCSFTEENDLLSQWRGYCPKGSGYSIGFKTLLLLKSFEKKNYKLVKCIYDMEEQLKIIDELLQKSLDKIPEEEVSDSKITDIIGPISNELINSFFQIAPMLKNSSFYEEKEWRFVSRAMPFGNSNVRYRPGLSMIIPYDEVDILTDSDILPVENIVIGPTQHPELSRESIKGILKTKGIERFSISLSRIPYREW